MHRRIRIILLFFLIATPIGGLVIILIAPSSLKSIGTEILILGVVIFVVAVYLLSASYEKETAPVSPQSSPRF